VTPVESVVEEEFLWIIVTDVDLTENIVSSRLNIAFGNSGLQPRKKELLDGLNERFDRVKVVHICDLTLGKICIGYNDNPEKFLIHNRFYDSKILSKYCCENHNPYLPSFPTSVAFATSS
jgi:hypothetical protein